MRNTSTVISPENVFDFLSGRLGNITSDDITFFAYCPENKRGERYIRERTPSSVLRDLVETANRNFLELNTRDPDSAKFHLEDKRKYLSALIEKSETIGDLFCLARHLPHDDPDFGPVIHRLCEMVLSMPQQET